MSNSARGSSTVRLHAIGATVEGVEVRSSHWYVGVCRLRSGELIAARGRVDPLDAGAGGWPFVRGIVCQLRQWSPPVSPRDWAVGVYENENENDTTDERGRAPRREGISRREDLPRSTRAPSHVTHVVWAVLVMAVPQLLAAYVLPWLGAELPPLSFAFQIVTALIAFALTIVYLRLVARLPEMRRVIQYNTAATKALVAYETGAPLTIDAVRRQSPIHPWAGANYIAFAIALSPAVFYLSSRALVTFAGSRFALHAAFVALKVASVPVILALTYEAQQLAVRPFRAGYGKGVWRILCALQYAMLAEPDDEQLDVAVSALRESIEVEDGAGEAVIT